MLHMFSRASSLPFSYFTMYPFARFYKIASFYLTGDASVAILPIYFLCKVFILPLRFVLSLGLCISFFCHQYLSILSSKPLLQLLFLAICIISFEIFILEANRSAFYPYYFLFLTNYRILSSLTSSFLRVGFGLLSEGESLCSYQDLSECQVLILRLNFLEEFLRY